MSTLSFGGGLNEQDVTFVKPTECIEGYNFELKLGDTHMRPRKPFDLIGTDPSAGQINGFIQLIKQDGTETTLIQAGVRLLEWDGASSFTSRATVNAASRLRGLTWTLGDYSVITDITKNEVIKKWDGTSITTLASGLTDDLYAKYSIVYLNRVWLFNVKAGTDTPHLLVASAFEDPTSYDIANRNKTSGFSTGEEAFFMTTPDLKPINGVAVYANTLIVSTENGALWKITGSDSQDFAWTAFYPGSAAVGNETMLNIGNDVAYMKRDGIIESLLSTNKFGDVETDDLSRWILDTTSGLTDCKTVYDQTNQKVYFFAGSNKLLVLFKNLIGTDQSPWSVYKTNHMSSFITEDAIYMRTPGGSTLSNWFVYFGDSTGNIYRLEGTGTGDNGDTDIDTFRKSILIEKLEDEDGNILDPEKDTIDGRVHYRRLSDASLLMDFEWADDYSISRCTVPLSGPGTSDSGGYFGGSTYFGGNFYFNEGFQLSQRVSTKGFSPVGKGPGVYMSLTIQDNQEFDIIKITI